VFATVAALDARGASPLVADPMFTDEELEAFGFAPYHLGESVDAAVVQADHAEYRAIGPKDLPGVRVFIDGRRVSSADAWPGVQYRVIGKAAAPPA
jgi:UDP-N-acetyl-D-mannosaminuronate dehydrogenase